MILKKELSTKKKALFWIFVLLTVLILSFIFSNSAKTADVSSEQSEGLSKLLQNFVVTFFNDSFTFHQASVIVRTFAHFAEFAALAFCSLGALENGFEHMKKRKTLALLFTAVSALIDETIQLFSEGRAFQLFDLFIDVLGGLAGILFFTLIAWLISFPSRRAKNG